jgi:hypothetical protein
MNKAKIEIGDYFHRFLESGAYCTPPGRTVCALANARTLIEWKSAGDRVRLYAEVEQESFADVFGKDIYEREKETIEMWGCHWVRAEYLAPDGKWTFGDSIGMCVYPDPLDPFQNEHVPDLMRATLDQMKEAWETAGAAI